MNMNMNLFILMLDGLKGWDSQDLIISVVWDPSESYFENWIEFWKPFNFLIQSWNGMGVTPEPAQYGKIYDIVLSRLRNFMDRQQE